MNDLLPPQPFTDPPSYTLFFCYLSTPLSFHLSASRVRSPSCFAPSLHFLPLLWPLSLLLWSSFLLSLSLHPKRPLTMSPSLYSSPFLHFHILLFSPSKLVSSPTCFLNFSHCPVFPCSTLLHLIFFNSLSCSLFHFTPPFFLSSPLPFFFWTLSPGFLACLTHSFALTVCVYIDILYSVCRPQHHKPNSTHRSSSLLTIFSLQRKYIKVRVNNRMKYMLHYNYHTTKMCHGLCLYVRGPLDFFSTNYTCTRQRAL